MARQWNNPNPPRPDQIDLARPVDWSHPQARGLVACYPFWLRPYLISPRDAMNRYPLARIGTTSLASDAFMRNSNYGTDAWYDNQETPITNYPFTLAAWANLNNDTNNHVPVELQNSLTAKSGSYLSFSGASAGNPVEAVTMKGSYAIAASINGFSAGQWTHGCGVFSASNLRSAFCDGTGKGTNSTDYACTPTRIILRSYYDLESTIPMAGKLGEVRIYNRALTDAEVYALWHPATRWAMLRTLTFRRTFIVPAPTTNRRRRALTGAVA